VSAVQRWALVAVDDRHAPPSARRYGQMVSVVAGTEGGGLGVGALGRTMSLEDTAESGQTGAPVPTENAGPRAIPRERKNPGDDLCSRKAALSVSSALESLTSVFGMGTGMASPLESPGFVASGRVGSGYARVPRDAAGAMKKDLRSRGIESVIVGDDRDSQPLTPGQLLKRSSPRPLVPLSFIRHRTSTCGLSNRWSPCGLTRLTRWGTSSRGELRT
jgi:hypothetical protein